MTQPPPEPIDLRLLDRYLAGACSPHESEMVDAWLDAHPSHRALVAALRRELPVANRQPRPVDEEALLAGLRTRIEQDRASPHPLHHAPPPPARKRAVIVKVVWRVAAAAIASITAVLAWQSRPRTAASPAPTMAVREIATKRGQRAELRLADGTRVVLGAESRLQIPPNNERDLVLAGEAYFVVTHDSAHPFRVRTATGVAEDLGTEFVVTAYPDTRGTRVAVSAGSVALRRAPADTAALRRLTAATTPPAATVRRGDVAYLDGAGHVTVTHHADLAPYFGWADGRLAFDGARFADAIPVLERWYDIEIQVRDSSLARQHLVAAFHDEATGDVLKRIALALGARVERHGRLAVFTARARTTHR